MAYTRWSDTSRIYIFESSDFKFGFKNNNKFLNVWISMNDDWESIEKDNILRFKFCYNQIKKQKKNFKFIQAITDVIDLTETEIKKIKECALRFITKS